MCRALWDGESKDAYVQWVFVCYFGYEWVRGRALSVQAWLGRRSIGIYAIHGSFMLLPLAITGAARVAVVFAVAMTASILLELALERTRWTKALLLGMRN